VPRARRLLDAARATVASLASIADAPAEFMAMRAVLDERHLVVAWLRAGNGATMKRAELADAIARGEHRKAPGARPRSMSPG
jgi:hypothetical protein